MSAERRARWLAGLIATLFIAATAMAIPLGVANGNFRNLAEGIPLFVAFTAFVAVGILVVSRHPKHPVGWIFAGIGLLAAVEVAAQEYAHYGFVNEPGSLPGAVWGAWVGAWWWYPMLGGVLVLTPLLFPTGHPPTRRWRWVLWLAVASGLLMTILAMLNPRFELQDARRVAVRNPLGIEAVGNIEESVIGSVLFMILSVTLLASVASLVVGTGGLGGRSDSSSSGSSTGPSCSPCCPFWTRFPRRPCSTRSRTSASGWAWPSCGSRPGSPSSGTGSTTSTSSSTRPWSTTLEEPNITESFELPAVQAPSEGRIVILPAMQLPPNPCADLVATLEIFDAGGRTTVLVNPGTLKGLNPQPEPPS